MTTEKFGIGPWQNCRDGGVGGVCGFFLMNVSFFNEWDDD